MLFERRQHHDLVSIWVQRHKAEEQEQKPHSKLRIRRVLGEAANEILDSQLICESGDTGLIVREGQVWRQGRTDTVSRGCRHVHFSSAFCLATERGDQKCIFGSCRSESNFAKSHWTRAFSLFPLNMASFRRSATPFRSSRGPMVGSCSLGWSNFVMSYTFVR